MADGTVAQPDPKLTAEKTGTPSYSQEQVDKMLRDAKTSVLADVGRAKKAAEDALARLSKLENERREAELEAAKDDPEALRRIKAEQRANELESKLADMEPQLNRLSELDAKEKETERAQVVTEIATRLKTDPERLKKLAKFTDGTREAIEEIARELPKGNPKTFKPDSGGSIGGTLSFEDVRAEFIKDPRGPYREAYYAMRKERK